MTVMINGYEVEIKAKGEYATRFNKEDTKAVLNLIGIFASEAANRYEGIGMDALKRVSKEAHKSIYETLEKTGYYN